MTTIGILLLLQAAVTVVPNALPDAAVVAIPTHVRAPCEKSPDPDEIVVCGKSHDDRFRLKPIPLPSDMKKPIDGPGIDFDVGNAHGNVYSTSEALPDGQIDKRIMVGIKMPF